LLIGVVAGLVSGLLGVGGAFVIVPALVGWRGLPQRTAQATSLGTTAVASTIAAATYLLSGLADEGGLEIPALLALMVSAPLAAALAARRLPRVTEMGARRLFGLAMLAFIPAVLLVAPQHILLAGPTRLLMLVVVGAVAGTLSGFLGIGSGLVLVPLLVLLVTSSQRVAQGLSLLAIAPTALAGSLVHWRTGLLRVDVVVWVAAGAAIGAGIGASLAQVADEQVLRWLLVGALGIVGLQQLRGFSTRPLAERTEVH
jgi:uncharacterized membrane protein YfcA